MRYEECRAESAPCIAGCRLNKQTFQIQFPPDTTVGDAIQRHTAGHNQVLGAGYVHRVSGKFEHRFFHDELHGCSQVHLAASNHRLGLSRWPAEQLVEASVGHQRAVEKTEIAGVETEGTIVSDV